MSNKDLIKEDMEEVDELAEVEAAADSMQEEENFNDTLPYVVTLSKEYRLDGEPIKEVDLSGLEDLTTKDAQDIDRVMSKMKYHPANKFQDILYTKHIAMRVTKLPVEFFNSLSWKDMQAITSRIAIYFLF